MWENLEEKSAFCGKLQMTFDVRYKTEAVCIKV
jgi:hypothetical protein